MSDDIEKLLAEVNNTTPSVGGSSKAQPPARKAKAEVESSGGAGGRLAFAVVSAVVFGVIGFVVGIFVPFFLGGFDTGVGASIGAFLTALVAGPPRWFSS
jgi:predicted Co/Zn/Cd cation transporter (cation efflux family)